MKRLISTICVFLIVFNSVEYFVLIGLAKKQLTEQVLQKIEANSNELGGNLILAIPLEYAYSFSTDEYTPISGEFAYEGELYRMVKQKFHGEMLYIVCIRESQDVNISSSVADYSRLFSGEQSERTNSSVKMFNSLSKDYIPKLYMPERSVPTLIGSSLTEFTNLYHFSFTSAVFRPPQHS